MNRLIIEDRPPYRSYRPTFGSRLRRFITANDIPFALWFGGAVLLAAVCLLIGIFGVTQ